MKKSFIVSFVALLLAIILVARIVSNENKFRAEVTKSMSISAGYDNDFINLVNRLEKELALRAQFGFKGKKDPLTGKRREIAEPATVAPVQIASIAVSTKGPKTTKPTEKPAQKIVTPTVRVTAIIFDDVKNSYTAMIMEGDRSLVLEVGDVYGRGKVTAITNGSVTVTDSQNSYTYDLRGQVKVSPVGQI